MIVFVDERRPTGIGESLSGAVAFYINAALINDWHSVETHPDFQRLDTQDQDDVRAKFPRCVEIHRNIKAAFSHAVPPSPSLAKSY
jgi:hypothetical protein